MSFLVREISPKEGMDDFLSLPSEIYRNDPGWVAPGRSELKRVLDPSRNPYFRNAILKIYVCYFDSIPVCRSIMVINHLYWIKWNRKPAFFGFFESSNNVTAVKILFEKIVTDSRLSGAEYLEGPFNPNHYSELGIQTDGFFDAHVFFETHNPPYYSLLLKEAGFSETDRFHTRINTNIAATLSKKYKTSDRRQVSGDISVRKFNIFRFKRDLEILRKINNDSFENNKYFLPLSAQEYRFSARYLFLVCQPRLILIAEYKGEPIGATQFLININSLLKSYNGSITLWDLPGLLWKRKKIKELIVFTTAVKKAFRKSMAFAMMLRSAIRIFQSYTSVSTTWIADDNLGRRMESILEMKPGKHFALYSKQI